MSLIVLFSYYNLSTTIHIYNLSTTICVYNLSTLNTLRTHYNMNSRAVRYTKEAVRTMRRLMIINLFWVTLILSLSRPGMSVGVSVYPTCVLSTVSVYTNTTVYYLYTLHKLVNVYSNY